MQPDALAEARAWLQKASNDLRGADIDQMLRAAQHDTG
jgi:hypothetical protein